MRKVALAIAKLGINVGNKITIKLVDSVGKNTTSTFGYTCNQEITVANAIEEIELLENEFIPHLTNYKIILQSGLEFTFTVPYSTENPTPHDLISLLSIGCVYGIIDTNERRLDDKFVEKINLYFTGENPHFTDAQKDVMNLYEYYANEVIDTTYTIDVIQMMDEYLSTLKGETTSE